MLSMLKRRPLNIWRSASRTFVLPTKRIGPLIPFVHGAQQKHLTSGILSFIDSTILKSMIGKYFDGKYSTGDHIAETLSPEVIATMMAEVTKSSTSRIDHKTVDILVDQAVRAGSSSSSIIDELIKFYLRSNNVRAAANVLRRCEPEKIIIPERTCQALLSGLVENCNWNHAFTTAIYMICNNYSFTSRSLLHIVGGLIGSTAGVAKTLELMKCVVLKRRGDLAEQLNPEQVSCKYVQWCSHFYPVCAKIVVQCCPSFNSLNLYKKCVLSNH